MWKQTIITLLIICFVIVLLLFLQHMPTVVNPVSDISQLDFSQDFKLSTRSKKALTKGANTFEASTQQTILYDAETRRISSYKMIRSNDYKIKITEVYSENQLYITVNDIPFRSNMTFSEYCGKAFAVNNTLAALKITYEPIEIPAPKNCENYHHIDTPEALYALEMSCNYLMQAYTFTAEYSENIYIEATGDRRKQTIYITAVNESNWCVTVNTTQSLQNDSRINQISKSNKSEHYCDGIYKIKTEDEQTLSNSHLAEQKMRKHLQNRLISTLILPEYIDEVISEDDGLTIRYTFIPTKDFATCLYNSACENLYQNPNRLKEITTDITIESMHSYLTIEKATGLPVNSGIIYNGKYKISEIPYRIEYHATQSYKFDNQ